MFELKEKVAVVTGGRRGMGRAHAVALAAQGAHVVVTDVDSSACQPVVDEIRLSGSRASCFKMDVSDKREVDRVFDEVIKEYGKIDILVNNAGIFEEKKNLLKVIGKRGSCPLIFINEKAIQILKDQKELENLETYENHLIKIQNELKAEEQTKQDLSQKALELSGKVGEAKQLVSRSEQLIKLNETKLLEKTKLTESKQIFDELTLAFGKKGIQAMIIENAIPEIEDEANRLLEKLTEGRMKIKLETQKETKTKVLLSEGEKGYGTIETLEIVISDEMGERPYELYSGGETFRVNFAIRLAISKLLTHRAGARLQFLVIDEGFGTQDAPGRARLVEVLDTIKNDFEKILVITHIEELKEEFPVRIEVSKNSGGSTFEVVGI